MTGDTPQTARSATETALASPCEDCAGNVAGSVSRWLAGGIVAGVVLGAAAVLVVWQFITIRKDFRDE